MKVRRRTQKNEKEIFNFTNHLTKIIKSPSSFTLTFTAEHNKSFIYVWGIFFLFEQINPAG